MRRLATTRSRKSRTILTLTAVAVALLAALVWPASLAAGEETPAITGRLLDPYGEPVSNAHVTVLDGEETIGEAESNIDGSFLVSLERLPRYNVTVQIGRAHFHHQEWHGSPEELQALQDNSSLHLPDLTMERRITIGFWVATLTFLGVLALIAMEKLHDTLTALLGMAVIFLVSYIGAPFSQDLFILDFERALHYINFEVFFLVMGMMIVIGILEDTGIFQWLAYWSYRISRGRIWLLSIVLMCLAAIASALLDNVTTMLLMTPITLQIALALRLNPLALLIPEVLASNVGGIATLIGTPTNILIGSYAGLTFNDFVANLTPGVLLAQAALIGYVQIVFRKEYRAVGSALSPALTAKLAENARITKPVVLRKSGVVFTGMLVLFVIGERFHLGPAVTALIGSILLLVWIQPDVDEIIRAVDWTTLLFFIGLFVCVGALEEVGLISQIAVLIGNMVGGRLGLATGLVTYAAAFLSMVIANIPFTAAMLPVVAYLTHTIPGAANNVLFYSLSIGAAMGGNGSLIGASANLVTAGIAERAGYPISYKKFMRYGLPSMVLTVTIGLLWLFIRF
ncbi:MAG: citrate transporter [Chloroflexi bacterium]|nr:citrate transporter [Chloroflexota bacterium]